MAKHPCSLGAEATAVSFVYGSLDGQNMVFGIIPDVNTVSEQASNTDIKNIPIFENAYIQALEDNIQQLCHSRLSEGPVTVLNKSTGTPWVSFLVSAQVSVIPVREGEVMLYLRTEVDEGTRVNGPQTEVDGPGTVVNGPGTEVNRPGTEDDGPGTEVDRSGTENWEIMV